MDIETLNIIAKSLGFFIRDDSHMPEVEICLFYLQDAVVRTCSTEDEGTDYDYARVIEEMASMYEARKMVCDTLHASTCSMTSEDRSMQDRCWEAADGFGKKTLEELKAMDFDWSHIRDSSADAFDEMHLIILRHRLAMSTKRSQERTKAREQGEAA